MKLPPNHLYNQDCIKGMGQLEPGSVDLVFADPPFNIGYKYDVYEDKKAAGDYLDWTRQWGQAMLHALKPNGSFFLAIGDDFAAELKLIFQKDLGLVCRSWIIWYYTFGVNCKTKFSRSHTHIFHFVRNPKAFTFNAKEIKVPSARQLVYGDSRAAEGGRLPDDTWILRPQDATENFTAEEDVWYFPRVCGTFKERAGFHGCQMPEQLLGRIIKVASNPGELVMDPFGGSGTTLITAKKLGRQFVGFELSKNYAKRVQARLEETKVGEALLGAEEPKVSAPSTKNGKRLKDAPSVVVKPESTGPIRATREDIERGILEAFLLVRDGWSADRVVADPYFNAQFLEKCRSLGVAGSDVALNQRLYALRKSSHLKGLPHSRRTKFLVPTQDADQIEFALEIALQRFRLRGKTLDNVVCDPRAAAEFDDYVNSMIQKPLPSIVVRWLGFRLRKMPTCFRDAAAMQNGLVNRPQEATSPFDMKILSETTEEPGIYWLWAPNKNLYVGSTLNLRKRLDCQFFGNQFDFWGTNRDTLQLSYLSRREHGSRPMGQQSKWIGKWKPEGNYEKFAASA